MRTRSFFSAVLLVVLFVELAFPIEAVLKTGDTDASSHKTSNKNAPVRKNGTTCNDKDADCLKLSSSDQEFSTAEKPSAVVKTPSSSSKTKNEDATNQAITYEIISMSMVKQKPAKQVLVFKECDDEDDCEPSYSSGDGDKQQIDDKKHLSPKDSFATGDSSSRSSNADDVGDPYDTTYEMISKSIMELQKPLPSEECDDEDDCKSSSTGSGSGEIDNNGAVTSYTSNDKYNLIVGGFLPDNDEKHPIQKDFFTAEDSNDGESPRTNNGWKTYEVILKSEMTVKNAVNVEDCDDEDDCKPNFSGSGEEDSKAIRGLSPPKDEMSANPSTVPFFLGTSFLAFPPLGQKAQDYLKAEITIKPLDKSGLLLYNGWDRQRIGDFISLALRNGYVELSFNCGSGEIRIRSTKAVTMNEWSKIKFYRSGRLGSLTVNTDSPSLGFSPGPRTNMFLHQNLSIGGVPGDLKQEVEVNVGVSKGFTGYIRDMKIKGNAIDLMSHAIAGNIENDKLHPCSELPCKNGGTCVPDGDKYSCECTTDYRGQNCEKGINLQAISFHTDSYIYFKKSALLKILKGRDGAVTFSMKTTQLEGLIIWETQQVDQYSKRYVTVSLKAGYISLSFEIGFGKYLFYSTVPVNDGQWHTVTIERTGGSAALVIDEIHRMEFKPVAFFQSEKNIDLYIGGVPDIKKTEEMHHSGFDGCMGKFQIKKEYLDFAYDAVTAKNTGHCV